MKTENAIILILIILIVLATGFYIMMSFGNLSLTPNDANNHSDTNHQKM